MLSSFAPWCAETCISASERESQKPHQGFAGQKPTLHRGVEWSKSTLALGLPEWAGKTVSGPAVVANNPVVRVDPTGLSYLDFVRSSGTLRLYYADGSLALECSAANHALGNGPWPPGWYYFDRYNHHLPDPNGPYGSYGIYIFKVPGRTGMGVHSGRANKGGPNHPTEGCVRTTNSCMDQIMGIVATDPLTSIYIDNDSSHR